MAFQGFGKNSGPALPPKNLTLFGNISPLTPTHEFQRSSNEASQFPKRTRSPPLSFNNDQSIADIQPPPKEAQRSSNEASQFSKRTRSPPLPFNNNQSVADLWPPPKEAQRWGNQPNSSLYHANSQAHQRPIYSAPPSVDANNVGTRVSAEAVNVQAPKMTRSPPLAYTDEIFLGHSHTDQTDTVRPAASPPRSGCRPKLSFFDANSQAYQRSISSVTHFVDAKNDGTRFPAKPAHFQVPKRSRSPPLLSTDEVFMAHSHTDQIEIERLGNRPKSPFYNANSEAHQRPTSRALSLVDAQNAATRFQAKAANVQVPKRMRSPPLSTSVEAYIAHPHTDQIETEREMQAKAKRLARFNVELNQMQGENDLTKHKGLRDKNDQAVMDKRKFGAQHSIGEAGYLASGSSFADVESTEVLINRESESSSVIVGLCSDMCPESEREERERKGDLDKYERLDGDRNQTSKSLAVKKYNRTAEREASLIRPMPVLQKTVDYLLDLLNQPYDDKFLGLYNFLWDRMRAIRMDLRMQHIFDHDAITMKEQMIRFHIIAMHELCEYTKGEGFSEGFDAHLNIEQMNKTSVELFQMYDDHRKKGNSMPMEKEFRGYYALLKLDKHPGYKVEPAELSLDLAKMPLDIRHTAEILFAREVARACRTGNFVAFFRLARRATYLQACLMHTHFAKLRTQALASLHSSLQHNQGIPVAHVVKWLAMEEEDIESLLGYRGFLIKHYEDAYMVKEGQFLKNDKDYPTRCSQLVHSKKSRRIIDDVSSGQILSWPSTEGREIVSETFDQKTKNLIEPESLVIGDDEDMADYEDYTAVGGSGVGSLTLERPLPASLESGNCYHEEEVSCFYGGRVCCLRSWPYEVGEVDGPASDAIVDRQLGMNLSFVETGRTLRVETSTISRSHCVEENLVKEKKLDENEALMVYQIDEVASAKLKLILRKWKRRSLKQREIRELHRLMADAALSSLSLGPPIQQNELRASRSGELNINQVVRERHDMFGKSWSRLNVSEVVAPILKERNPHSNCLCWKLIICSQINTARKSNQIASSWLISKLMGTGNEDGLAVSSPGLSIWKKWVDRSTESSLLCCLSVIRDATFDHDRLVLVDDLVSGSNGILFLLSDDINWEIQKVRLHNLLMSIPPGSKLPLLILSAGLLEEENPDPSIAIINRLELCNVDTSRISNLSVLVLDGCRLPENSSGFLSDRRLKEGLQWLANQSPLHPVLCEVKTRELVLSFLGSSMEVLDDTEISEVGPNLCIKAFNEALDRSIEEIRIAVETNYFCWPSPEIGLIEEFSREGRAIRLFLPKINWSSDSTIREILSTIGGFKLPLFMEDFSWLNQGSYMGKEIESQKLKLESCLNWYLTQASKVLGGPLAASEASLLVQKGATLGRDRSDYFIIPKWVIIFRRIFNWRLMNLKSSAYVLKDQHGPSTTVEHHPIERVLTGPSLDEMVEVGCRASFAEAQLASEVCQGLGSDSMKLNSDCLVKKSDFMESGENFTTSDGLVESSEVLKNVEDPSGVGLAETGDKLRRLLEKCDVLQNMIDQKLSIYF